MESISPIKCPISLPCCLVLLCIVTTLLNPVFGTEVCEFPAIFNFGDSNSDTGGIAAAFFAPTSPYGDTYFHRPAGRVSDGRLIIDFIAKSFGLPYLSAYLNSLGTNFTHGANFATAASTIRPPPSTGYSPFYLDIQYNQFKGFMQRTQFIRRQGGIFASLMPKEEYFAKALYTFDIGQNDLGAAFNGNKTLEEVKASVPDIINSFSTNVKVVQNPIIDYLDNAQLFTYFCCCNLMNLGMKNIYNLGARYLWIHNTGPIGCLPYILDKFLSAEKDELGCAKPYNKVAQYFNVKLKEAVVQLRKDLPLAAITYIDIYSAKYSLISNANKYGEPDSK